MLLQVRGVVLLLWNATVGDGGERGLRTRGSVVRNSRTRFVILSRAMAESSTTALESAGSIIRDAFDIGYLDVNRYVDEIDRSLTAGSLRALDVLGEPLGLCQEENWQELASIIDQFASQMPAVVGQFELPEPPEGEDGLPDSLLGRDDHDELVALAVERLLGEDERAGKMVLYRYYMDLTEAEIGNLVDVSESTVSRSLKRSLKKLREYIEELAER